MADDRRRRFTQIERPRGAGGDAPDPSPGTGTRFGALEEPGAPPRQPPPPPEAGPPSLDPLDAPGGAPVARGHTDRFRPAAAQPLEVDDHAETSQPFIRCARCETDSSRYAARCTTCGAPLDTDEQRLFNERLWAGRRSQAQAEEGARAAREAELDRARQEATVARQASAEQLAREVGESERRRLDAGGFGEPTFGPPAGGWGGGEGWGQGRRWGWGLDGWGLLLGGLFGPGVPIGFRLLGGLPAPWGIVAGVGAVALAAGLFLINSTAGFLAGVVLVGLFTPGRRRRW